MALVVNDAAFLYEVQHSMHVHNGENMVFSVR